MTDSTLETLLAEVSRPHRHATRMAILCAACAAIAGVLLLGLSGWFITGAALAGAAGVVVAVQAFNYLLPSAAIRLLAIVRTTARYGERLYGHMAALSALALFRVRLFEKLIGRPLPDLDRGAGETTALLLQDVDALEDRFIRTPGNVAAFAGAAAALALAIVAGPLAISALFVIMAAIVIATRQLARGWLPEPAIGIQQDIAALKQAFVEYAAASPEIAAYGLGISVEAQLQTQASLLDGHRTAFARWEALLAATVTGASGLAMAAILALSTATLPLTLLAALAAAGAIEALGASVRSTARDAVIAASLARLAALVNAPEATAEPVRLLAGDAITIGHGSRTVRLVRGDRLTITGRSGSGKTSLLEWLAGRRANGAAHIEIDGQATDPDTRRPLFGLSPQDAQMLAGTIADNLRIARAAIADEALWRALDIACLATEVRAMPEGLATWVGDGGTRLSGGQRKRLSLARAILAGRPWLLLDEPTEGLDPATEGALCARLKAWLDETGTGLILVTHRPALSDLAGQQLDLDR